MKIPSAILAAAALVLLACAVSAGESPGAGRRADLAVFRSDFLAEDRSYSAAARA